MSAIVEEFEVKEMIPGILVVEECSIKGGIRYKRRDLENYLDGPRLSKTFETNVIVDNVTERREGIRLCSKARNQLRKLGARTPVGLICPADKTEQLVSAIKSIRMENENFNQNAETCLLLTRYALYRVESDNNDTISAITSQIADIAKQVEEAILADDNQLLEKAPRRFLKGMTVSSILSLDKAKKEAVVARIKAELIRSAIAEAKGVSQLLPDEAGASVRILVKQARQVARKLCKRVEKKGETLESVLNEVDTSGIRKTRMAFVLAASKADKRAIEDLEALPSIASRRLHLPQLSDVQEVLSPPNP